MTKIAIASCCKIQIQPVQPAWSRIKAENPDLLLLLGDNVYMKQTDGKKAKRKALKAGMVCEISYAGNGGEAKTVKCSTTQS